MRSGKKSIAVLAAVLALVLAVQAFAFTAVKLGTSDAADSVEAGVTRQVMDAKPENKTTVVKVTQSADGSGASGMSRRCKTDFLRVFWHSANAQSPPIQTARTHTKTFLRSSTYRTKMNMQPR